MLGLLAKLPVAAKVVLGGITAFTGFEIWKHYHPKLQSLRHTSLSGHPIQVVVPVNKVIPMKGIAHAPIPPNNGTAAAFVPPPPAPTGQLGIEPSVITPTGAANLAVNSVTDLQNALNALGKVPPLKPDGINGPLTSAAIASYQAAHGMTPSGQIDPTLQVSVQGSLGNVAGTQSHIGQSIPVQAAEQVGLTALHTPAVQAVISSGLSDVVNLFSSSDTSGEFGLGMGHAGGGRFHADTPATGPAKDTIIKLQRVLNLLGASPPLDESGAMSPETVAAVKAFQITYGLVADGVPAAKTVTAMAVAIDPAAQVAVLPSIPKAADHVASVAASIPTDAPAAKPLADAAADLKAAAAIPAPPTDAQVHASTAASMAATVASVLPPPVAAPLAEATHALAAATATPSPDVAHLTEAATHLTTAAAAAVGTPAAPSIQAAAVHVAAAATAPDISTQGDHLNAAAMHLSNAAAGTPAPSVAPPGSVAASGEFGWDLFGWWRRLFGIHPAYQPPVPTPPGMPIPPPPPSPHVMTIPLTYQSPPTDDGGEQYYPAPAPMPYVPPYAGPYGRPPWEHRYDPYDRHIPPTPTGHYYGPPLAEMGRRDAWGRPVAVYGDFGYGGGYRGYGGGYQGYGGQGGGGGYQRHHDWQQRQQWQQQQAQQQGQGYQGGQGGGYPGGGDPSQGDGMDAGFGYIAPPTGYAGHPAPPPPQVSRPAPPTGQYSRPYIAPPPPQNQYQPNNSAYWQARQQSLGYGGGYGSPYNYNQGLGQGYPDHRFDRRWFHQQGQYGQPWAGQQQPQPQPQIPYQPPPIPDPNQVNPYQDPNAGNPSIQDPSLDAQSNGGGDDS